MAEAGDVSPELTEEQQEKLMQFQDVTGKEDVDECRRVLDNHDWDMESAVQDTFNEDEGTPPVFLQSQGAHTENSVTEQENNIRAENSVDPDYSSHHVAINNPGIFQHLYNWLTMPFQLAFDVFYGIIHYAVQLVWPSLFQPKSTPLEDVTRFRERFEEAYGTAHPTFYLGSYSQALEDAKKELRFLLVYLHSWDHEDTPEFCRSVLSNEGMIEYVNGNMLMWAADVQSAEGYRVSRALRETTYPFLAVVCLREARMTMVMRIEGIRSVDSYIARLARTIEDNEPALVAARAERQERSFNQTLRDEQDQAYMESLLADQEKERKRKEEENRLKQEEEAREKKQRAAVDKVERIAQEKKTRAERIPEEPESGHEDAIRIMIKLPDGSRLERRFLKSDKLQALYDYTFCSENSPHSFTLVTNFPRKVFEVDENNPQSLEEVGLTSAAMLFVHDTTEDSSDEES